MKFNCHVFKIALSVDQNSLARMYDVLNAMKKEMVVGTHLWISFQTNVIKDFGYEYPDNWEDKVAYGTQLKYSKWWRTLKVQ